MEQHRSIRLSRAPLGESCRSLDRRLRRCYFIKHQSYSRIFDFTPLLGLDPELSPQADIFGLKSACGTKVFPQADNVGREVSLWSERFPTS